MTTLERLQSLTVAAAAVLGLAIGSVWDVGDRAGAVVMPALVLMVLAVFLQTDAAQVAQARQAPRVVGASLVLNFVLTPLLAWALGAGLLGDAPDLRIGLLLLLVTPCTDWYLVFTALGRGHTGIAAALLPVNLLLQLALLPLYITLLGGQAAGVGADTLAEAVLVVLVVPLVGAVALRQVAVRSRGPAWRDRHVLTPASRAVLPLLHVAVLALFAWQAPVVVEHAGQIARLLVPLALFFVLAPLAAVTASRALSLPPDQRVTLVMTTTARNSPIALAVAVVAFPDRPLVAVALVVGPLVELPVLAALSQVVRVRREDAAA
jgi:arsenite transporter